MRKYIRYLVKLTMQLLGKRKDRTPRHPVRDTAWELFPYSFGVDWFSPNDDYHLTPVCNCYYCRRIGLLGIQNPGVRLDRNNSP